MDSINTRTSHCLRVIGAEVQELRRVLEVKAIREMHCLRVIGAEIQKLRCLMEEEASRESNRSVTEVQPLSEDTVDNADRSED
jgi:hypothetical protein